MGHPLSLAGGLILYSILTGLLLGALVFSWLTYLLILVFLGGVMVLVVYITTLAANEKLIRIRGGGRLFIVFRSRLLGLSFLLAPSFAPGALQGVKNIIIPLFEASNTTIYLFRTVYLLLALVCVVKVIKLEKGPLVKRL